MAEVSLTDWILADDLLDDLYALIEVEDRVMKTYESSLPLIDTPELADRLRLIYQDHHLSLRDLSRLVAGSGSMDSEEELAAEFKHDADIHEHRVSIGDTLDTAEALASIIECEELAAEFYERALTNEMPDGLREVLLDHRDEQAEHLAQLRKIDLSVAAAAKLWGPLNQPPILRH